MVYFLAEHTIKDAAAMAAAFAPIDERVKQAKTVDDVVAMKDLLGKNGTQTCHLTAFNDDISFGVCIWNAPDATTIDDCHAIVEGLMSSSGQKSPDDVATNKISIFSEDLACGVNHLTYRGYLRDYKDVLEQGHSAGFDGDLYFVRHEVLDAEGFNNFILKMVVSVKGAKSSADVPKAAGYPDGFRPVAFIPTVDPDYFCCLWSAPKDGPADAMQNAVDKWMDKSVKNTAIKLNGSTAYNAANLSPEAYYRAYFDGCKSS